MASLAAVSVYLLMIEVFQLIKNGVVYFTQVWNYLDISPPVMVLITLALDVLDLLGHEDIPVPARADGPLPALENPTKGVTQGVMGLLIWIKVLYFMRIFESTGYLIRIIIQVCIDMRHFLFILLLTLVAFGEAIAPISLYSGIQNGDEGFTGYMGAVGYVYRIVLGDFSVNDFAAANFYMSIIFILCTVLNSIIMMNLLIAIISESFA